MYDLLEQGEPDTLPGCITYQIILSEFIDKYGCDDHEGRVLIGNKTNGEIITLMKELDDLSIDNQSDITFECGSFRVLEYSQGDAHYKLSEESLSQKLIDPGISEPYNKKCTALDDEFNSTLAMIFWGEIHLAEKAVHPSRNIRCKAVIFYIYGCSIQSTVQPVSLCIPILAKLEPKFLSVSPISLLLIWNSRTLPQSSDMVIYIG